MKVRDTYKTDLFDLDDMSIDKVSEWFKQHKENILFSHPDATDIKISIGGGYDDVEIDITFLRDETVKEQTKRLKKEEQREKQRLKYLEKKKSK